MMGPIASADASVLHTAEDLDGLRAALLTIARSRLAEGSIPPFFVPLDFTLVERLRASLRLHATWPADAVLVRMSRAGAFRVRGTARDPRGVLVDLDATQPLKRGWTPFDFVVNPNGFISSHVDAALLLGDR